MVDYKEIKFLESTSRLRDVLSKNAGRDLSLERANQISVCLEQGRLFFETAQQASWEIKPLLVYYGMVGFAKAIYLARNFAKLENLAPRHGLTDISTDTSIQDMRVRIEKDGTFHALNDSCSKLEKLIVYNKGTRLRLTKSTSDSPSLAGKEIGIKEILSRIPDLGKLYKSTFGENPKIAKCSQFGIDYQYDQLIQIEVFDVLPFEGLSSLEVSVRDLRRRFPFLEKWRVRHARPGMLKFANLIRDESPELSPELFNTSSLTFDLRIQLTIRGQGPAVYVPNVAFTSEQLPGFCEPVRGNLTDNIPNTCLLEPWNGLFLSELSLYYLGMFLLSSLIRYRPNLWANAIARRSFPEKPVDDRALVLIEELTDSAMTVFSKATVVAITETYEDPVANSIQSGSDCERSKST